MVPIIRQDQPLKRYFPYISRMATNLRIEIYFLQINDLSLEIKKNWLDSKNRGSKGS